MLYMVRYVPSLLPKQKIGAGNLLSKLLIVVKSFLSMSEDMVRKLLFFGKQNGLLNQGEMLQPGRKSPRGKNGNKLGKKAQR